MSDYPGAIPDFTGEIGTPGVDAQDSPSMVDLFEHATVEIVAIATELGTDPAGASADVKARLVAIEAGVDAVEADIVAIEASVAAVQAAIAAIDEHPSVRLATIAALAANTRTGDVLTASANGAMATIDGVAPAVTDRVLVKDEATGANRGLYVVTSLGSGGAPWVLTRAADADSSAEVTAGLYVTVDEGGTLADTGWLLTTNNPITLNTTALTFTQFPASAASSVLDSLNLPAGAWVLMAGSAALGLLGSSPTACWAFTQSSTETIGIEVIVPTGWNTIAVDLWWSNPTSASGNVRWGLDWKAVADGGSYNAADAAVLNTIAAPAQYVAKKSQLATGLAVTAGGSLHLILYRLGADAADTLSGDASMVTVNLRRLT